MIQNGPVNHEKSQQQCLSGLNLGWDMCLTPVCLTPMLIFFGDNQYFWAPDFQANQFLVMSGCQASISPPTGSAKSAAAQRGPGGLEARPGPSRRVGDE